MEELTGPQLNVLGVQELVESNLNKVDSNNNLALPMQTESELKLEMDDKELIKSASKWSKDYADYYAKIEKKQITNRKAWMGKEDEGGVNIESNLIFEAESTMEPQALSQNPEPVVWSAKGIMNDAKARGVKVMLQYHATQLSIRPKMGKMLRHWDIYYTGALKHGFNTTTNDISTEVVFPSNLILDPKGYVNEDMSFVGKYIGEKKQRNIGALIKQYPKKESELLTLSSDETDSVVTITEWWTDQYMFVTYNGLVLEKNKNPHYNWDNPQANHFAQPCKPYTFLSVYSLGNQPHDNTTLIEQVVPNQRRITRRINQIDKNISLANNSVVIYGGAFTEDQAKQASNARENGDPIYVPATASSISGAIETLKAPSLPNDTFNELEITKTDLRSIFGTAGSTPSQNDNDRTVRGKILDRNLDVSRSGAIGEALEKVASNVFNWWTQLYYVYYDEPHYASIMGGNTAVEYVELSQLTLDTRIIVSVAPNSMRPKDELTEQNFWTDLYMADRIDPLTYFEKIDDSDPTETAKKAALWMFDKQTYMMTFFPEQAAQMQQGQLPPAPEMGIPADTGDSLSAIPASADLSQVPLNTA